MRSYRTRVLMGLLLVTATMTSLSGAEPDVGHVLDPSNSDGVGLDLGDQERTCCAAVESCVCGCQTMRWRYRTPGMVGDFLPGSLYNFRGIQSLDRLLVLADDLDVPLVLPPAGSALTVTEPGPVGIYSTPVSSVQQLQALLRANQAIPPATLVGAVNADATVTTAITVGQIQTLLGNTADAFDIIPVNPPPASYTAGMATAFAARHAQPGTVEFDAAGSGSLLQGGVDALAGEDLDAYYYYNYLIRFDTRLADAASGGVGRMKIAEGGTILPQDRMYFRYSYLNQVQNSDRSGSLSRYVPGFEKSFFNGLASIELRAPFASDVVTSTSWDGNAFTNGESVAFGNLSLYPKVLLIDCGAVSISGGLGIVLPTAQDRQINYANGTPLLNIANESVRLQPFLGGLYTPSRRFFAQGFIQVDAETMGNTVGINAAGAGLVEAGKISDRPHLFLDLGMGYWLYQNDTRRGLTGIIPILEVHQNIALRDGDTVAAGPFIIGDFRSAANSTTIVAGTVFEFNKRSQLTAAYTGPVGGGTSAAFDGGLQVMFSHQLGR